MRRATATALGVVLVVIGTACEASTRPPTPSAAATAVPFGGERASILPQELAAARERIAGGLAEPSWLPESFELIFVAFDSMSQTATLRYEDDAHYMQIDQVNRGPAELGPKEPFDYGDRAPVGNSVEWRVTGVGPLDPDGSTYTTELADGRTVSIHSDLDAELMGRVLESIYVRAADGD